jgi:hypothetical protein
MGGAFSLFTRKAMPCVINKRVTYQKFQAFIGN